MFKRVCVLLFSIILVLPTLAQGDDTPQVAIDAALTAVEAQFDERATNFTFQFLGETNDSSLGCPLIEGEELPFSVTALRVDVIYPNNATYTVFTTLSGQVTLLCDNKFEADVLSNQLSAESRCNATPTQTLPAYEAPSTTVEGVFAADAQPYPVYGVSSDGGWYQVASDLGLGWIDATSVTLSGDCTTVPTTSVTNPTADIICFVEPQGGFTNVRATPDGDLVGRIYENEVYQITTRNTAGTWFYIQPAGWVSNTVIFQLGDCNGVTVNDNSVGVGFGIDDGVVATDVTTILEQFRCPADFEGYLIPRIVIGEGTAQVSAGGIPNTLRAFPSVDDNQAPRIGVIQPQRVIDRVLSGPACNQGFVWWFVQIDDTTGWTAESNQSTNDYFLEPTGDSPITTTNTGEPSFDPITVSTSPITELIYSADGTRLFALTTGQGFGDGQTGIVAVYDSAGNPIAQIEEPSGIADIDLAEDINAIMVAARNGTITLYDGQSLEQIAQLTDQYSFFTENPEVEITSDGNTIIIETCDSNEACTGSMISIRNMTTGEIINSTSLNSPVVDMILSQDDTILALMVSDTITFHDAQSLETLSTWEQSDTFTLDSVILDDIAGSALLVGCNNADCSEGRVGLVDVNTGNLLGIVPTHESQVIAIAYNNQFTRFATLADESSEIIERNATTGEETQTFDSIDDDFVSLVYTPDGRAIAVGTTDGRIIFLVLAE